MRFHRFIFSIIIVTFFAVCHVHQRVEMVKAGYDLQRNMGYLASLTDKNAELLFKLSKVESPKYLLASFDDEEIQFADYRIPQQNGYRIALADHVNGGANESFIGKFLDLFTLSAEARPRE
ncbi:MAG: hypothetical protein ABH869_02965 [Candidatus Omnitrophota bacterium]